MKINSLNLSAFFAVARLGHFTMAAKELHITQSALSQRVAKLEEELETTLFIRDKKNTHLTNTGQDLLRYCQVNNAIELEFLEKLKTSNQGYAGPINIGCFSSVGRSLVVPSLVPLLNKHPNLSLNLLTDEIDNLEALISNSSADYIITTKQSENNDLEKYFLGHEINVLVKSKKIKQKNTYLDHDIKDQTTKLYFKKNKLKFNPKNFHYLDDVYGLIDGVKSGLGAAVLPLHLIKAEKDIEVINPSRKLKVPVYLQFYRQPFYRSLHQEVVSVLKGIISKTLN